MSKPIAYGIDFGTSNSAISVAYDSYAEMVPLGGAGETLVPSVIYLDETGNQLVGNDAIETFLVRGGHGGRLMSTVKSFLSDEDDVVTVGPDERHYRLEDIVAILLRSMKKQADAYCGRTVDRVVVGHPVVFAGAEGEKFEQRQQKALDRLVAAARIAGFRDIALMDESEAALQGESARGTLMSLDFGGGTFDVSIMDVTPDAWPVVASEGAAVGGERFDALLFDATLSAPLGLNDDYRRGPDSKPLPVPNEIKQIRTRHGILQLSTRGRAYALLSSWRAELPLVWAIIDGGHAWSFYRTVEEAKIALSNDTVTAIAFSRPGIRQRLTVGVRRSEFEDAIKADLDVIDETISRALEGAGCVEDDIDLVVPTGGSSQIPAFVHRVTSRFGEAKVSDRDPFNTVALGLGLKATELWGQ